MARRTFNQIRLYGEDGTFQRWVTPTELEEIDHKVEPAYEMRGDEPRFIGWQLKGSQHQAANREDETSLSEIDSQANVGITGGESGQPAIASAIASAQARVKFWPLIGDTKAVRVGPRVPEIEQRRRSKRHGSMQAQSDTNGRSPRPSCAIANDLQPVFAGD